MMIGLNWTLSCDSKALCEKIADQFGGRGHGRKSPKNS
jgi:hypothetical protein